ncbi:gamma-glutamyltransferase [Gaopeijia maritima]
MAASPAPPVFPAANRPDVRGTRGAVVSDHPLASAAAHDVLRGGGNAVDAAIAAAGVLAVVRPHMNGVGGDAFALIYEAATGTVHALNGSGRAGALATPAFFDAAGVEEIPQTGPLSVSVPGAVAAWADAADRFGTRPLAELLAPAVSYARDGFPVSTRLASDFESQGDDLDEAGRALFLPNGAPPEVGSLLRNPALAGTLETIGREGAAGFYTGEVAAALAAHLESAGGYLRESDFAQHTSSWVDPLSVDYLGHTFLVMPPNTQGVTQLQQMGMAQAFDVAAMGHNSPDYLHTLIEIKKRAFADRDRWVADPDMVEVPTAAMLDPNYLRTQAEEIDASTASDSVASGVGDPRPNAALDLEGRDLGDTVYLTVVDADGNAVSWIQSLYAGFGSGILEPTTGVVLQNRGALFTLDASHPNVAAPGKRPFHTLTPMLALRDGSLAFTLGTPGGDAQTQSLLQIVHNLLLFGMTPQEAVEAPRFRSYNGVSVAVEDRLDPAVRDALTERGHALRLVSGWTATFGGAQMILRDSASGTLTAAADPRREAYAIAH